MPWLSRAPLCILVISALVVGIVSALVLKKNISQIIRSFDGHLFWTYCCLFVEKGWEIFWGPTVFGISFGLVTLWYTPLTVWFIIYLFTVFLMTGYYLWRENYVRLQPKFKIDKIIAQLTETEAAHVKTIYLQVLPECTTDAHVLECRARLLLVSQLNGNGEWVPTQMNSPLKLGWDYYGHESLTIEPGIGQRLNICWWDNQNKAIVPTVEPRPSKWRSIIGSGPFKFDVRMSAKDCAPIDFSVRVSLHGRKWDDPEYELIHGRS